MALRASSTLAGGGGGIVTSVTGTANQVTATPTTGDVVVSLASPTVQLGGANVDTGPIAQTLRVQGPLVGGTSNIAGPNWTLIGALGKGNANSGDIIIQTGGAVGASGTTIATATTALTIAGVTGLVTVANSLTVGGTLFTGNVQTGAGSNIIFAGRTKLASPSDGVFELLNNAGTDFGRLQFGGTTSSFPALKRNTTSIQGRLADDSAFCPVQGKLTTDVNATTGLTPGVLSATTNATIVLYDASGQAYRVPCII